jgi:hypothetical protein
MEFAAPMDVEPVLFGGCVGWGVVVGWVACVEWHFGGVWWLVLWCCGVLLIWICGVFVGWLSLWFWFWLVAVVVSVIEVAVREEVDVVCVEVKEKERKVSFWCTFNLQRSFPFEMLLHVIC